MLMHSKTALTTALAVTMLLFVPFLVSDNADADSYIELEKTDEGAIITGYIGDGYVRIPESYPYEGVDCPIIGIGDNAFEKTNIVYIELPETLKFIGNSAFWYSSLQYINMPSMLESIGDYAFGGCYISDIEIPSGVNKIGKGAFYDNRYLNLSVDPENTNFKVIDDCLYSFDEKTLIGYYGIAGAYLEIPGNVETIGECAFMGAKLNSMTIGSNVKTIESSAFSYSKIIELTISDSTIVEEGAFTAEFYEGPRPLSEEKISGHTFYFEDGKMIYEKEPGAMDYAIVIIAIAIIVGIVVLFKRI
jgi:hypothetical protein